MSFEYINFDASIADGRWSRRGFWRGWRSVVVDDPRWAPPPWPWLQRTLAPAPHPHFARMHPLLFQLEAMRRRTSSHRIGAAPLGVGISSSIFEETVGATVMLTDPRAHDRTAYLALLHVANDEECLDRLIQGVMEQAWERGYGRLLGPVGLLPVLGVGALANYFNVTPPLHTPYNPPYVPELLAQSLDVAHEQELYVIEPGQLPAASGEPAVIVPAPLSTLEHELLPLLQAVAATPHFPPMDALEAAMLVDAVGQWPASLWVARVGDEPVGFVLLQDDHAPLMRRTHSGRNPLWRPWIAWQRGRPARAGRMILGGVLPARHSQGIGRQLWRHALTLGHVRGWEALTVGPVDVGSPGAGFLVHMGAEPRQRYALFASEL